jgi:flagellar biogenesis protein FliO
MADGTEVHITEKSFVSIYLVIALVGAVIWMVKLGDHVASVQKQLAELRRCVRHQQCPMDFYDEP